MSSSKIPYLNRDTSWMYFNSRVLQEAHSSDVPLLERLSFLGIYSNNLDEFFRVRMATNIRVAEMTRKSTSDDAVAARKLIKRLTDLDQKYSGIFQEAVTDTLSELSKHGVEIIDEKSLDDDQKHYVRCHFRNRVGGFLSPVWLSKLHRFSDDTDSEIYLGVKMTTEAGKSDYAVIPLPTSRLGRFVMLPEKDGKKYIMYIDDVVRFCLPMVFPGMDYVQFEAYSFKFTKDAEMDIDNDLRESLMQKVAKAVKQRKRGAALRVLHDKDMPAELLDRLLAKLKVDPLDTIQPTGRYQNHKDLMDFPDIGRADLKNEAWASVVPEEVKRTGSVFRLVREKDRFIHVPYHSFDFFIRFLQEAAISKDVKSIKISLYRVASHSKVIEALMCAARNGKKVTALVELMARFDESSNISWAKRMQDAGINVIFGVEGLKVHSKIVHIGMKKGRDMAVVSTGNFHEGNARSYTDYLYFTARQKITSEVDKVFDFIRKPYIPVEFNELLVSPNEMRDKFYNLVDAEIKAAGKGKEAWIKIKINHITDDGMVEKLYEASRAGVRIDISVRGNCSLYTGMPVYSENIRAVGIIDRYLEHSRIFIFCSGGKNKTFIGSADWMPRNLDRRIEVVTPIYDDDIKRDLMCVVNAALSDNVKARIVDGSGRNLYSQPKDGDEKLRSQEFLYRRYVQLNNREKENEQE